MKISLRNLAHAVADRVRLARRRADLDDRLTRPHLARDLGLPTRSAEGPQLPRTWP